MRFEPEEFEANRVAVDERLPALGYRVREGKVAASRQRQRWSEAQQRASRRTALLPRRALQHDYFHAVLEALLPRGARGLQQRGREAPRRELALVGAGAGG